MPYRLKFSRGGARLRAPLFATLLLGLVACDSTESVAPVVDEQPVEVLAVAETETASASFAGGIPFGMTAQPISLFGSRFSGGKRTIGAGQLLKELPQIRSRGGRVVLMMAGHSRNYQDGNRNFSLEKWKNRINQYRGINFKSYIDDGTVIGHYLIDEPNDPKNWGGKPVSASMVEEMAKYSKSIWPNLPTIVRVQPDYLNRDHRYLDAAWAQYLARRGNVNEYIKDNVSAAQSRGLQLVVGLNVIHGGNPQGTKMTAKEVEDWGSALLSSGYPCAFIMWQHNSTFLSSAGMGNAMDALRRKAEGRPTKSCKA